MSNYDEYKKLLKTFYPDADPVSQDMYGHITGKGYCLLPTSTTGRPRWINCKNGRITHTPL